MGVTLVMTAERHLSSVWHWWYGNAASRILNQHADKIKSFFPPTSASAKDHVRIDKQIHAWVNKQ
jgi:hypothetical protein